VEGDNKYYRRSRISEWKFRVLVRYFALDLSATDAARLINLTRKTTTVVFLKIRRRIAQESERNSPFVTGRITRDESHSCTICICGRSGCGVSNKTPVFALLKHDSRIYTEIAPDCRKALLRTVIRGRTVTNGMVESNGWHGFDGLVDVEYEKPFKVTRKVCADTHQPLQLTDKEIETFWNFAKRRLEKFYGVSNHTFYLHLKECEWRYNMRGSDAYSELLKLLRKHPI
jgi:transposase